MRIGAWPFVIGVLVGATSARAEAVDLNSAIAHQAGCVALVETETAPSSSFFDTGVCAGQMHALLTVSTSLQPDLRFCPPRGTTNGQAARVVVQFLNEHPLDLDQNFFQLAVDALRTAFPCR